MGTATLVRLCRHYASACLWALYSFFSLLKSAMETRLVRKTFGWIAVGGLLGLLAVAGLQLYLHSNLSAQEKISQEAGLFHENIETALTSVNAQQSALIEAAGVMRLDARALGAAEAAQLTPRARRPACRCGRFVRAVGYFFKMDFGLLEFLGDKIERRKVVVESYL